MESRTKKKNQDNFEENHDLDRLSSLPDSILCLVLSYLDTKSVVRTSVLAKRYKLLWTLSPCLDFTLFEFNDPYSTPVFPHFKNSLAVSLESYVFHVLHSREHSNLTSFRLSLHKEVNAEFIETCVEYAAQHKVQHLKLRGFVKRNAVTLPEMLLTSSSLLSLHLHNATSYSIELPKSVNLPNLKVLCLKNFEFSDKNYNGELFSGCPNLETLVLSNLDVNFLELKNLEIRYWRSPWRCFDEHMINVNAPKLAFFKFQGHLARVNFKENLSCLEQACIDLCYPTACKLVNATERKQKASERFVGMLRCISNVKFVSLSSNTIEIIHAIPDLRASPPLIFENLRFLKFTTKNKYREKTMRTEAVVKMLSRVSNGVLILDGSKEPRLLPESSRVKSKRKDSVHIAIPANVMHYMLENAPSLEYLCIEIPKASSDQE
ncbi:hypothetical protein CDL12_18124 [Handroanthus impetiginosus]|uniref:F-box domain-containing protein n=1 Tax=Handroanthus impetiginosus TaxID=429701 RepID=A0A2G9GVI5_9LAMI|nr:hypothetical protein CDL12_18124 [Handroanthus impetiginosus]